MRQRTIVCPLIEHEETYLLCKMPSGRGVFPGQWALSGGGMEPGETIEQALLREVREELGESLELSHITPWTFRDDIRTKTYPDGRKEEIYMIYLIFHCQAKNTLITLNDEFERYAWVRKEDLAKYDLNEATRMTLKQRGLL
ncbi:nucleoside triphosphatase NudI [Rahnella sp. C60]|jgi:nucleoside triphosphatase|uniref:Nucleoside triphosphatase NudI n=1 Tax=Rahnella perminowiae TaxID=2816244 RepID=A0ABS6L2A7_9GAMM|nr:MULTISPECIES: nucleoside triphosphatase NudI [Rahnella]UJD89297.1 nucleoside triphosphatase NudI [Rahnella aquatilis]MBU9811978.1 nucleoside triphosphatase NudI [Rahnella perminowiae]MBU9817703.1 nucleoside triphosphatase NudI [Rahnella perminowiae]MBU9828214.1 nucleoside triphosphatase NudI [Rahnella perminowiae]MBU9836002.1 nucleoside triphosphatase NudI [Rahnella perminowiae]